MLFLSCTSPIIYKIYYNIYYSLKLDTTKGFHRNYQINQNYRSYQTILLS